MHPLSEQLTWSRAAGIHGSEGLVLTGSGVTEERDV